MFSSGKFLPTPSASSDPYFNYTTLLLKENGTNGAQNNTFTPDYSFTSASPVPGGYAAYFGGFTYLTTAFDSAFNFGTGDFTVECWVNLSSIPGVKGILGTHGSYTGGGWGFYANSGVVTFQVAALGSASFDTATGSTLSAYTWTHIAAVRYLGTLKVYVNGVSINLGVSSSINGDNSTGLYIGAYEGTNYKFTGYVSNVRVVKGVAVYTSDFTTPTPPLTAISGTSILTCQSATFIDNSVNNFTITNNGGASIVTSIGGLITVKYGNSTQGSFNPYMPTGYWSGYFDGSGDYLSVPSNAAFAMTSTTDFTIECWFYIADNSPLNGSSYRIGDLFSNISTGVNGYEIQINGNSSTTGTGINFINYISGTGYPISYNGTISQNVWYHIAVVRSGTTTVIYLNGVSVASGTLAFQTFYSNSPIQIGRQNYPSYTQEFNGYISNMRFVKGTAVYTSNFTPSTTPLTAISNTTLLCLQDSRFKDNSSNAFTLTPNGDTKVKHFNPFAPSGNYTTATYGGSMYLDGTGDYVIYSASSDFAFGTGDFTVECWIYPTSTSAARITTRLADSGQTGSWGFNFSSSTFSFTEVVVGEPGVTASGLPTMLNTWTHLAVSRQGTTLRLFANGVLVGSGTNSTNFNYSGSALGVGATNPVGSVTETFFPGYISNLRIVKGTAVYTGAFTPPSSPVTAVANTVLLLNPSNAGIYDATTINDIETGGSAQVNTTTFKYGSSSIKFNGSTDYLAIPGSNLITPSGNFTAELWCYPLNTAGNGELIALHCNTSAYGAARMLRLSTGAIQFLLSSTGSSYDINITGATGGAPDNQWTHVALVRNGSSFVIYLNGTSYISTTLSSALYAGPITYIGGVYYISAFANLFNGYIDELRITNGIARYTTNFTIPAATFPTR